MPKEISEMVAAPRGLWQGAEAFRLGHLEISFGICSSHRRRGVVSDLTGSLDIVISLACRDGSSDVGQRRAVVENYRFPVSPNPQLPPKRSEIDHDGL